MFGASVGHNMRLFSSCGQRQGTREEVRVARVILGLVGSPETIYPERAGVCGSPLRPKERIQQDCWQHKGYLARIAVPQKTHYRLEPAHSEQFKAISADR